jgi:hypothetical protein
VGNGLVEQRCWPRPLGQAMLRRERRERKRRGRGQGWIRAL